MYPNSATSKVNIIFPPPSLANDEIEALDALTPFTKNVKSLIDVGGNCEPADGSNHEVFKNVAVFVDTVSAVFVMLVAM